MSSKGHERSLEVLVEAPFFDDPPPPTGSRGRPCDGLWDHEVVELFLLGEQDRSIVGT